LKALRDAAVAFLCGVDVAARYSLLADLAGLAAVEQALALTAPANELHLSAWLCLWGGRSETLQPVALRLLAIPPSAARGERILKALKGILKTRRNRVAMQQADMQTRLVFNSQALRRLDLLRAYRRPVAEQEMWRLLEGDSGTGAPLGLAAAAVGGVSEEPEELGGSSGDDTASDDSLEEDPSDGATVDRLLGTVGIDAAVDILLARDVIRIVL